MVQGSLRGLGMARHSRGGNGRWVGRGGRLSRIPRPPRPTEAGAMRNDTVRCAKQCSARASTIRDTEPPREPQRLVRRPVPGGGGIAGRVVASAPECGARDSISAGVQLSGRMLVRKNIPNCSRDVLRIDRQGLSTIEQQIRAAVRACPHGSNLVNLYFLKY